MRIVLSSVVTVVLLLPILFAPKKAVAQDTGKCLYNDGHFHIQDFKADGPRFSDIRKMMDNHVCRNTLIGQAVTVAHDPLIDRDFAPAYYTQTEPMGRCCTTTLFRTCWSHTSSWHCRNRTARELIR